MSAREPLALGFAVLGCACALACSSSGSSDNGRSSHSGARSGSGTDGGSGPGLTGGGSGTGTGSGGIDLDSGAKGDGALTRDGACGGQVLKPEAVKVEKKIPVTVNCSASTPEPITIYIVLDNSGSMADANKWNDAVSAITSFVSTDPTISGSAWTCVDQTGKTVPPPPNLPPPGSGSLSVGIQYFHPQNVGGTIDECNGAAHATPAVPVGELPAVGPDIVSSLGQTGPGGNTPTTGALTGGTQFCASYQTANPGKRCVVVLVTDGQPNGCGLSSNNCPLGVSDCVDPNSAGILVPIASNAYGNTANSVTTFTVGMAGVSADGFTLLNQIAVGGGSDCSPGVAGNEACNITTGGAQAFLDALNNIRKAVQVTKSSTQTVTTTSTVITDLPCEWTIPKPPAGKTFDKGLVNVTFSNNGYSQKIGNVPTLAKCGSVGGWYYDDNTTPKTIHACPDTCTAIQSQKDAKVEVLFGCATEPAVIQ